MQEMRKEKHTVTSKKHDKKCLETKTDKGLESKSLSESGDLKCQLEILQQKFDALIVENANNVKARQLLEEKIHLIESQDTSKVLASRAIGVQTDTTDIMFCHECEYPAETIYDLGEHMYEFHSEGYESKMDCHYCEESFATKDSVMKHQKKSHTNKVKQCTFFSEGACEFGDKLCWFNHNKSCNSSFKGATSLKCKLCDKTFHLKWRLRRHAIGHETQIRFCHYYNNGVECPFEENGCMLSHSVSPQCWFKESCLN